MLFERRPRKRVVLSVVGKKKQVVSEASRSEALISLRIDPPSRIENDVDIILSYLGNWPSFKKILPVVQAQREIARNLSLEKFNPGDIVCKEGSQLTGHFIVFSGSLTAFSFWKDDSFHQFIPPNCLANLFQIWGPGKFFAPQKTYNQKDLFGICSPDFTYTIYVNETTELLYLDQSMQTLIGQWFKSNIQSRQVDVLAQIKEFQLLEIHVSILQDLAETLTERELPAGTVLSSKNPLSYSLIIIESGILVKKRIVSPKENRSNPSLVPKSNRPKIPKSSALLRDQQALTARTSLSAHSSSNNEYSKRLTVSENGPGTVVADPSLAPYLQKPYTLEVKERATVYLLSPTELEALIPKSTVTRLKEMLRSEPTDDELWGKYYQSVETKEWSSFKQQVVKDTRRKVKLDRDILMGTLNMRQSKIPKALKESAHAKNNGAHMFP